MKLVHYMIDLSDLNLTEQPIQLGSIQRSDRDKRLR